MDDDELVARVIRAGSGAGLVRSGLVGTASDGARIAAELVPLWSAAPLLVTDVRVNGNRIDARTESEDGRAWLAVLWADRNAPAPLVDVTVYERPMVFPGASPGTVIVLNGPSSVGKSSLMAAFMETAPTPWACLDEPIVGRLSTRYLAWLTTAGPVEEGFLAALAAAARTGNQYIVSSGGIAQSRFRDALMGIPTLYVGLDAPLEVLVERQLTQTDKFGGLAEASVGIHEGWEYDLRIDTSIHRPADGAGLLLGFVTRSQA